MKAYLLLPLLFALSGASFAQGALGPTGYLHKVTVPQTHSSSTPQAAPFVYDVSPVGNELGSSTVTFVSTPAPSVLVRSAPVPLSDRAPSTVVVGGELQYAFSYTGAASSYVPIAFSGLFSLKHGLALFNRSELGVGLSTGATQGGSDGTGFRNQQVGMSLTCSTVCTMVRSSDNLSSISAPFATISADSPLGSSSANGSFFGTVMGATDAAGNGYGIVTLTAFASGFDGRLSEAFVDPHLAIDPSYLLANPGASLTLPPGVGNAVTAVPEPQSLALMLVGLVGVAAVARRRAAA